MDDAAFPAVAPAELGLPDAVPLPERDDWRIGMVGFGRIARGAHAPAYRSVGWPIVAVADPDPQARQNAKEQFGVERLYEDHRDLVADEAVEVVDLLTQPTVREEVVAAAAGTGKPLITEKPLAESLEACLAMVEAAERGAIPLAVHQNYRWRCMAFLAHHIVRHGLIGTPYFASIEIYGRQDVALADHPFYATCDNFLTIQWDNHLADLLRYWTGREPRRVLARTGRMPGQNFVSDNLLMVLHDFGDGLSGHVLHTELLRSRLEDVECRIEGDGGSIVCDFDRRLVLDSAELGGGPRRLNVPEGAYAASFAGSMGDFLLAIETGREPQVSARRNLPTMRTILAETASAAQGGAWVDCGA
ncbi:MAG: Gfo/Idh/MocA family protein [Planctomycetota bacterium]